MDEDEGPFTVWQMLNAPTIAVFKNLEIASDALERLLKSVLKSTCEFSDVLVPKAATETYPQVYYESFDMWLLGRIFYTWSSKSLKRIHQLSKEVQIKILYILITHKCQFSQKIHGQYKNIVEQLINYCKINMEAQTNEKMILKYFQPELLNIPKADLCLQPIFVEVNNVDDAINLLELTLQILVETVPLENMLSYSISCDAFLKNVLDLVVYFNMEIKLIGLNFLKEIISNFYELGINYTEVSFSHFTKLLHSIEDVLKQLITLYVNGEIIKVRFNDFNKTMAELLTITQGRVAAGDNIMKITNICSIILDNKEIFTQDLYTVATTILSELKMSLINEIQYDINFIPVYSKKLNENLTDTNSKFSNDIFNGLQLIKAATFPNLDSYAITTHMKKFNYILTIYTLLQIKYKMDNKLIICLPSERLDEISKDLTKICKAHKNKFYDCKELAETYLNTILMSCWLHGNISNEKFLILVELCCLDVNVFVQDQLRILSDELQGLILRNLLILNLITERKLNEHWSRTVSHLVKTLWSKKNVACYKILTEQSALLILNKQQTIGKIFVEVFNQLLSTKTIDNHQIVMKTLPVLACMSFENHTFTIDVGSYDCYNIYKYDGLSFNLNCETCHKNRESFNIAINSKPMENQTILMNLFEKYLNDKLYVIHDKTFLNMVVSLSRHGIIVEDCLKFVFNVDTEMDLLSVIGPLVTNILASTMMDETKKESLINIILNYLIVNTRISLKNNDIKRQNYTLRCIQHYGLTPSNKVLLPITKLLIYFIMDPKCSLSPMASLYLTEICQSHGFCTNQIYHRYKKDFCKLFAICSVCSGNRFTVSILKVVRAFGFTGYRDFITKDVHHFLPYLIPFTMKINNIPTIIEEIASLIQVTSSELISERFPHIYTHIYLYEEECVTKESIELIEKITETPVLMLIKKHFRVILTEFLLQYYSNPEKVLQACRYLAKHDPDGTSVQFSSHMSISQIADFLHPRFLGILAYFDNKLINTKVALSVKRRALQSFPDIIKLMGPIYMTPLRFKILATLRSALILSQEFPKIVATAWSTFVHNIDTITLGPLLSNLAIPLLQQIKYAPSEINKIFHYLIISNENLLSKNIADLFFLCDFNVSHNIKNVVKKHVQRSQPIDFIERVDWYLQHLLRDIAEIKLCSLKCLNNLLEENRSCLHKAIFVGQAVDPVIVELRSSLIKACLDPDKEVKFWSGACLGQLGAIDSSLLPRQYTKDIGQFAFSINDDCFARTALIELTKAFQYETDTKNIDCYALMIQEILKVYNISPRGSKKDIWDSFPDHMHQIMLPLLSSRYTLAFPTQAKKVHPIFGSAHGTALTEWAYNWSAQMIPTCQSWLVSVHASMRRDIRSLKLFLPYILIQALSDTNNHTNIKEEILTVISEDAEHVCKEMEKKQYRLVLNKNTLSRDVDKAPEDDEKNKCRKMVFQLLDFVNRWLLEWCHTKKNPTENVVYKNVSQFAESLSLFDIGMGSARCGQFTRALQYIERAAVDNLQKHLPMLAELYALLDEPDAVSGILTMKRCEPSLKELILAQVVTGQLQDAAASYERLLQDDQLDENSLKGMVECYLGLDQPFTAYRLLMDLDTDSPLELAAEPMWRLGLYDQLEQLVKNQQTTERDNWGMLMARTLLAYRSRDPSLFQSTFQGSVTSLLSHVTEHSLPLHIVTETKHAFTAMNRMSLLGDGAKECSDILDNLLTDWRFRLYLIKSNVTKIEPLLRCRRLLLEQAKKLLECTHPVTSQELNHHIGNLWLQSAKFARKAGILQQAYTYILNAEKYNPSGLFIEKAKTYWCRGQKESAFVTLKRALDEKFTDVEQLPPGHEKRKLCAKTRLLIATYSDESTSVDVDVNITMYKEAIIIYKQWEKSLASLAWYYEKSCSGCDQQTAYTRKLHALNYYGAALQHGHRYIYRTLPRMLSIWLDFEVSQSDNNSITVLTQMCQVIEGHADRLPSYLFLSAFSQIVSRICHPVREVYQQLKAIIVKLILAYPQHTLWMLISVIKSSYPQRHKRCQELLSDARLKEPDVLKFIFDFNQLADRLVELCNKPIASANANTASVSAMVRSLPRLLSGDGFSQIMVPFDKFRKFILPGKAAELCGDHREFKVTYTPLVYIAGIEDHITILPSLQKPRKVTLKGSDGNKYIIMLKPKDDLRKDFRLMEFNDVVNGFLKQYSPLLYIRTYAVLPLNEECGLIQWLDNLLGFRPILMHIYKQRGIHTSNRELKELMCANKDPLNKKRKIFEEQLLVKHPPVFDLWFRRTFHTPDSWYEARSAYIRTTAVMSMVGYILGLGDRHGENILFDSTNGDSVHVDFNCLFNKGEAFECPERVPFRLTHNMEYAMGPLGREGMFRKTCESTMRLLRSQATALTSVLRPFVYDPLLSWQRSTNTRDNVAERTNHQATEHLQHIQNRLNGMVRTKNKQFSLSLSPEGQVEHLIEEATSIVNLCQMYIGWGPFL